MESLSALIVFSALPNCKVGEPYLNLDGSKRKVTATFNGGLIASKNITMVNGALPDGLSFEDATDGWNVIGVSTKAGSFPFLLSATAPDGTIEMCQY
jgi:hypothetical protein